MFPLSSLPRFRVVAPEGVGRLLDFAYVPDDADHHMLTHCAVRFGRAAARVVAWDADVLGAAAVDVEGRRLRLEKLPRAAEGPQPQGEPGLVWLGRDVLDALILDLGQRRALRADDLWLEQQDGRLRLAAADTGLKAVARRLTRGRYAGADEKTRLDWKYVEFLRGSPEAVGAGAKYHRRIVHLPAGEIAALASSLPYLHTAELLALLPAPLAADTLEHLSPERRLQAYEELRGKHAAQVLEHLSPEVAADLLGQMETGLARRRLLALPRERAERIVDLLRYPEDSVGGIMTNDVVAARANLTAGEARVSLRPQLREPDFVYFVYVVSDDDERKLRGVVSLRDLLVAEDEARLEAIMNPYLITLGPLEPAPAAARRVIDSQLAALPVVGQAGQLLGAVTIDAAAAVLAPRSQLALRLFS
jgi:CBS domain-containing protein